MNIFHHAHDSPPLGLLLQEARQARALTLEQLASETRISPAEIQALEQDRPLDPRRARIQAVSLARALGLDPAAIRGSLPPLPELSMQGQNFLASAARQPRVREYMPLEMLAPMGKLALSLFLITLLLGLWGVIHQISRVRPIPGLTSNSPVTTLFFR